MPTTNYKAWDVVLIPFPFTDRSAAKQRPALIINADEYRSKTGHFVMLMITSAKHSLWYSDVKISDLSITGLNIPSLIRFKMFSLDEKLIIKKTGSLTGADIKAVKNCLNKTIAVR